MSNIFKKNTRFSDLIVEPSETLYNKNKDKNKNKCEPRTNFIDKEKRKKEDNIKEIQKQKNFTPENFPDLVPSTKNTHTSLTGNTILSFVDKVKTIIPNNDINDNADYIRPGYIYITKDKITNKLIKKYGESTYTKKESDITIYNSIQKLVELYEKRTEEYIESWGYDEWEKMFRFPNYDYEYFDKLDDLYEEELEYEEHDDDENYN